MRVIAFETQDTTQPKFYSITKVSKIRFHSHRPDPIKTHQVTNISAFEPLNHAQYSQNQAAFLEITVNLIKEASIFKLLAFEADLGIEEF